MGASTGATMLVSMVVVGCLYVSFLFEEPSDGVDYFYGVLMSVGVVLFWVVLLFLVFLLDD